MDRTLFLVKPHAVERGLVGTFLTRLEAMRLTMRALRYVEEPATFWERFYPSDDEWFRNVGSKTAEDYTRLGLDAVARLGTDDPLQIGRIVKGWLVDHMSSAGSVAVLWEGNDAAAKVRTAVGKTLPNLAAPGTIRFDYSTDSPKLANEEGRPVYNLVHASDPEEVRDGKSSIEYEVGLVFPEFRPS